jgi:isocitrate dehydrogenase
MTDSKIIWTKTDEAPLLATYSLLPIIRAYTGGTGIEIELRDISLVGRIVANFPDNLSEDQKIPDHLTELGELAKTPAANIIKLPNISASIPQLQAAIEELQSKGYDIPDFPEEPGTDAEKILRERFSVCLGSAVNPVLREGNSDRRPAVSVKRFAQKHPHKMMKPWPESGSKARVAHMDNKDFFESEKSTTMEEATDVKIEFVAGDGTTTVLKEKVALQKDEVVDTAVMNVAALREFYAEQIEAAKRDGVLLSLHLKATMMKISDPIMFGHCVTVFYKEALDKHTDTLEEIGANVNNGLADVLEKLDRLPGRKEGRDRSGHRRGVRNPTRPRDGRLQERHHQPPRPQQRHRRRLDAERRSRRRQDVEQGRPAARLHRDGARPLLRDDVRGDPRGRQAKRPVRPGNDG